ncbi:MAG: endo-1,4-beta-xylanase [Spirochaetes bacterium]|nr:endo-1,4-beta-xylanase [Spirochaetota bacterium]
MHRSLSALLILCMVAFPQEKPVPPGGKRVIAEGLPFRLQAGKDGQAQIEKVAVEGQLFREALRAETIVRPPSSYALQLVTRLTEPVKKGDVMLLVFWIRAVKTSTENALASTAAVVEKSGPDYEKSVSSMVLAPYQWTRFTIPFTMKADYESGGAALNFHLGYPPQAFELASVELLDYGRSLAIEALPKTAIKLDYPGRKLDAPWRKAAEERIEKIRKGDLWVAVKDKAGRPVPGAEIAVSMKRHAFGFGTAVSARLFMDPGEVGAKYRGTLFAHYNKVVLENDLKWPSWDAGRFGTTEKAQKAYADTLETVRILNASNVQVRGHCLVWPSWKLLPAPVRALSNDASALSRAISNHILDEVGILKGQCAEWDVVNEAFNNHNVTDFLGGGPESFRIIADWYRLVRATDPKPLLFVNDYSILSSGGNDAPHIEAYERLIRFLLKERAPLDGIGLQSHMATLVPPETLLAVLDRFAVHGLSIQSTEFDINNDDDEAAQGDYLRDFCTALFSHASVTGIVMWGFWESAHWLPKGALWRKNWEIKPNGQAWRDLIYKTWWTEASGRSGADGALKTRGFLGDYEVTVQHAGKTKRVPARIEKEGSRLEVVLD